MLAELQSIAERTETSKTVFDFLSKRNRFRRQTNLNKFQQILMNQGYSVVEDDYINTFKALQENGVGILVIGRNGKPNRFKWHYNLKTIAKVATGSASPQDIQPLARKGTPIVKVPGRGPGRPRKDTSPKQTVVNSGNIRITLEIPANSLTAEINELLKRLDQAKKVA